MLGITPFGRLLIGTLALTAAALTPTVAQAASPQGAFVQAQSLPPGVVRLNDGETCPSAMLCLYRHYGRTGTAYGILPGHNVDLSDLPMDDGTTAADNISSWVNNTDSTALLIAINSSSTRQLSAHQSLEEPDSTNDTVDDVAWLS